jgi:preprotein translocase subunit SecE
MGKEKTIAAGSFWHEMFQLGVYKRSQGKVARQVTFAVLAITFALAAWRLWDFLIAYPEAYRYTLPGVVLLAGLWLSYRVVNYARFADFLIAVEAEMNKVSWPTRTELYRSALVVIFVIFFLATLLFGFDVVWQFVFKEVLRIVK